jgi:hypothetical protein
MKKLNLNHLEVSSFEPVAPPAKHERKAEAGAGYLSGAYGPDCPSLWPNCNRVTG